MKWLRDGERNEIDSMAYILNHHWPPSLCTWHFKWMANDTCKVDARIFLRALYFYCEVVERKRIKRLNKCEKFKNNEHIGKKQQNLQRLEFTYVVDPFNRSGQKHDRLEMNCKKTTRNSVNLINLVSIDGSFEQFSLNVLKN